MYTFTPPKINEESTYEFIILPQTAAVTAEMLEIATIPSQNGNAKYKSVKFQHDLPISLDNGSTLYDAIRNPIQEASYNLYCRNYTDLPKDSRERKNAYSGIVGVAKPKYNFNMNIYVITDANTSIAEFTVQSYNMNRKQLNNPLLQFLGLDGYISNNLCGGVEITKPIRCKYTVKGVWLDGLNVVVTSVVNSEISEISSDREFPEIICNYDQLLKVHSSVELEVFYDNLSNDYKDFIRMLTINGESPFTTQFTPYTKLFHNKFMES